jgi:TPR repeat protein
LAAAQGHAIAQFSYDVILGAGDGVPIGTLFAADYSGLMAEQGDAGARRYPGRMEANKE